MSGEVIPECSVIVMIGFKKCFTCFISLALKYNNINIITDMLI